MTLNNASPQKIEECLKLASIIIITNQNSYLLKIGRNHLFGKIEALLVDNAYLIREIQLMYALALRPTQIVLAGDQIIDSK